MSKEREELILKAIIEEYIETGIAVSSKAILEVSKINVSSATVRNHMKSLSDAGYLEQLHTSSGKVPSNKAYRYYVDYLLDNVNFNYDQNKEKKILDTFQIDQKKFKMLSSNEVLDECTSLLKRMTNYVIFSNKVSKGESVEEVKLVGLIDNKILVILVFSTKEVKDFFLSTLRRIEEDKLILLSKVLNDFFKEKVIPDVEALRVSINEIFPGEEDLVKDIIQSIKKGLTAHNSEDVIVDGLKNIFKAKEFANVEKIEKLMNFLENKENLSEFQLNNEEGINVLIGDELGNGEFSDLSVMTTNIRFSDGVTLNFGLIGPCRMMYESNLEILHNIKYLLENRSSKDE